MGWVSRGVTGFSTGGAGGATVSFTAAVEDVVPLLPSAAGGLGRGACFTAAFDTGAPSFFTAAVAFDAGADFFFSAGFFAAGFFAAGAGFFATGACFFAAVFFAAGFFAAGFFGADFFLVNLATVRFTRRSPRRQWPPPKTRAAR
jgi:hypothetical protein